MHQSQYTNLRFLECLKWFEFLLQCYLTIQGYRNEPSGILGYITRLDADWYLWKAFMLVMTAYSPDAVIHLGEDDLAVFR